MQAQEHISLEASKTRCRLCSGESKFKFESEILNSKKIKYYACIRCESLQTQVPDWLDLAYANHLASTDFGVAQRTLRNLVVSFFISKLVGAQNLIDIGGGDGLLCRFLRDYGLNAFVYDKYSISTYAQNFQQPNFTKPDLILAFEVLEHFADPMNELDQLFSKNADFYLFSTGIYTDENENWWYLTPETGQHIFFYSKKSIGFMANKFKLQFVINGNLIFFYKNHNLNKLKIILINLILLKPITWLLRSIMFVLPTNGINRDKQILQKNKS